MHYSACISLCLSLSILLWIVYSPYTVQRTSNHTIYDPTTTVAAFISVSVAYIADAR